VTAQAPAPPRGFGEAMVALRSRQKTSKGAPGYSRLVNRPLGRVFAALAYVLGRTPNQVTAVSALFTFGGIVTIALVDPTLLSAIGVCVMLVIGYALDAADGQLARLRGGGSVAGEWLDHAVDSVKIASLHMAVLVNWYRFEHFPNWRLAVPILFQIVASVLFFVIILNDQLRRAHRGSAGMILAGQGSSSTLYSLALVPTDYGLLCVVFGFMAWQPEFFWIYTFLMVANLGFLLLALAKWYREMRSY
jgi:phosphatidylglycerophosphate synthase